MSRRSYSPRERERIWCESLAAAQAERPGIETPLCNLCGGAVLPTEAWDVSHAPHMPAAWGGTEVGVGHARCNREHGATIVTPLVAKVKRVRRRHIGAKQPGDGSRALPCGRNSGLSKTIAGEVVPRMSGSEKHAALMAARRIGG